MNVQIRDEIERLLEQLRYESRLLREEEDDDEETNGEEPAFAPPARVFACR